MTAGDAKRLAYRFFNNCGEDIVLIDVEAHAEYWHCVYTALLTAKTWEEFRTLMPADEYARIEAECREAAQDAEEDPPQFSGAFSASHIPGYDDGDYPPFVSAALDQIVPRALLDKYATRELSGVTGPFWQIPRCNWTSLKRELETRGYQLIERNDLEHLQ